MSMIYWRQSVQFRIGIRYSNQFLQKQLTIIHLNQNGHDRYNCNRQSATADIISWVISK